MSPTKRRYNSFALVALKNALPIIFSLWFMQFPSTNGLSIALRLYVTKGSDRMPRTLSPNRIGMSFSALLLANKHVDDNLVQQWNLDEQFGRWKFLQNVLDDFVNDQDVEKVLFATLENYRNTAVMARDNDEGTLPTASAHQKEVGQELLAAAIDDQQIFALSDSHVLNQVEQLLPDPQEDEDAFKSTWETLMELHGRESVRVNEESATPRWKALNVVTRVLLQYGFLVDGI